MTDNLDGIDTRDIAKMVTANVIANTMDSNRFYARVAVKLAELGFDDRYVRRAVLDAIEALFDGQDRFDEYRVRKHYKL